jgi:hypothetical protein
MAEQKMILILPGPDVVDVGRTPETRQDKHVRSFPIFTLWVHRFHFMHSPFSTYGGTVFTKLLQDFCGFPHKVKLALP